MAGKVVKQVSEKEIDYVRIDGEIFKVVLEDLEVTVLKNGKWESADDYSKYLLLDIMEAPLLTSEEIAKLPK